MNSNLEAVSLAYWLAQTVAVIFFVAGVNHFDMYLWRQVFMSTRQRTRIYRAALIAMPILIGAVMLYLSYISPSKSVALVNVGIFVITLPLFDERITRLEYGLRLVGVVGVWAVAHQAALLTPQTLIGTVMLLGLAWVIGRDPATFRYHAGLAAAAMVMIGALFWLTVPWPVLGIAMDGHLMWQALLMYTLIGAYVAFYWGATHEHYQQKEHMAKLVSYERLTNEQNYRYNQEEAIKLMKHSRKTNQPLVIAVLDVDRYATFNQEHGYMLGNETLVTVAEQMEATLRQFSPRPRIYRASGEEFTIAFPNTGCHQAGERVKACLAAVRERRFEAGQNTVRLTLSAGLTELRATDETIDNVFKRADDNLRLSKKRGRDMYTCDGKSSAVATEPEELAFFAQPVMMMKAGQPQLCTNELLLRSFDQLRQQWQLPKHFDIKVEDQMELILNMLQKDLCQQVNINLTLAQFCDTRTANVLAGFARSEYGPKHLTIEITDVPDLITMRRISAVYRDAGVHIVIDDVGSDNSYELVQQLLPYVDGVKFAMQNLRKTEDFARIKARVAFWVEIAKREAVAFILEGVEDQQDVDYARELGIRYLQGYYYGKPTLPPMPRRA